ncbi:MAG: DUF4301 family protein [Cyclobacteriaceae bacterium]|nr:DUF4301 family protein [Cyclobacteriaceae bacterium]
MFSESDLTLLAQKGITESAVFEQINYFKKGFPYLNLKAAASVSNGIIKLSDEQVSHYINYNQDHLEGTRIVKFVPASGAASRMFKDFFGLMQDPQQSQSYLKAVEAMDRLQDFAFYEDLKHALSAQGHHLDQLMEAKDYATVLRGLLTEEGLNYGFLPKGLLAFHKYSKGSRAPMEEHLVEAAHYGRGGDGSARLHFTVSPQHRLYFIKLEDQVTPEFQEQLEVHYRISYSEQKASTDTVAVDLQNQPFRNPDGSILFRPGGHGALLENLNDILADVIFIKNIDNVVPDHLKLETYRYKRALAGLLLSVREQLFSLINRLEADPEGVREEATTFLKEQLNVLPPHDTMPDQYLMDKLNRPLRVCGMVKNQGEPGGGPFWVTDKEGTTSLQIVETSQIDPDNTQQQEIVQNATHFNPVDLICSPMDRHGQKFDLLKYRDPETGFISQKSKDGRELKALELPGLWNGAMAHWNTIFVEVPPITFNPVKTVNDLLRPEHQPE